MPDHGSRIGGAEGKEGMIYESMYRDGFCIYFYQFCMKLTSTVS